MSVFSNHTYSYLPCLSSLVLLWSDVNSYIYITSYNKMTSSVKKQTSLTNVEKITERAQALVLLDAGLTVKDVAKQLCKSERWVTKWRRRRDEY